MNENFNSLDELKERLKPALVTKRREMNRSGYAFIDEEDIWNYLKENKWIISNDLSLYQMVTDILNAENARISDFLQRRLMRRRDVWKRVFLKVF